ncbi:hypothetical protein IMCC3317_42160 [Kordia antarctica]|uniref:Uncharacterized protein n=1 Tax=Kordia antarctica TaxID=1218801 RepID=A0A7L4ZRI7_9FLAO|nr:hypothetical protein [Kordia antarctica]QHI38816.1 hypothetical protein IMCC3317_42160 [Kordia antarctica]
MIKNIRNKKYLVICLLFITLTGCFNATKNELELKSDTNFCDFNKELIYKYDYYTKDGEQLYLRYIRKHSSNEWELEKEATGDKIITEIKFKLFPDAIINSNQKKVTMEYIAANGDIASWSMTGYYSKKDSIWFHPPRGYIFKILEHTPFPSVKKPYKIGTTWKQSVTIPSEGWSDARWKTWEGEITTNSTFEIVDIRKEKTAFGMIDCVVIDSKAVSRVGSTELKMFFNPTYGFVKLAYKNIDDSIINLTLVSFEDMDPSVIEEDIPMDH